MRGKVPEVLHFQRNTFADPVEHRIRNGHVHIPRNAVSARLHLHMLKIIWLLEKGSETLSSFQSTSANHISSPHRPEKIPANNDSPAAAHLQEFVKLHGQCSVLDLASSA